jgi:hypothetical protein
VLEMLDKELLVFQTSYSYIKSFCHHYVAGGNISYSEFIRESANLWENK